jgi:hypothetical protein
MRSLTFWLKLVMVFGLLLVVVAGAAATVSATSSDLPPDEVVVRLRPHVSITTITARYNATEVGRLIENNVYFLKLPAGATAVDLLPVLNSDADLFYAEFNYYDDALPTGSQRYISGHCKFPIVEQRYISGHNVFLDANQN